MRIPFCTAAGGLCADIGACDAISRLIRSHNDDMGRLLYRLRLLLLARLRLLRRAQGGEHRKYRSNHAQGRHAPRLAYRYIVFNRKKGVGGLQQPFLHRAMMAV